MPGWQPSGIQGSFEANFVWNSGGQESSPGRSLVVRSGQVTAVVCPRFPVYKVSLKPLGPVGHSGLIERTRFNQLHILHQDEEKNRINAWQEAGFKGK